MKERHLINDIYCLLLVLPPVSSYFWAACIYLQYSDVIMIGKF